MIRYVPLQRLCSFCSQTDKAPEAPTLPFFFSLIQIPFPCHFTLQASDLLSMATELDKEDGELWVTRQICHEAMEDELHAEMCQKYIDELVAEDKVSLRTTDERDSIYLTVANLFLEIDALGLTERFVYFSIEAHATRLSSFSEQLKAVLIFFSCLNLNRSALAAETLRNGKTKKLTVAKAQLALALGEDPDAVEADIDAALRENYGYGELWTVLGHARYTRDHGRVQSANCDQGRESSFFVFHTIVSFYPYPFPIVLPLAPQPLLGAHTNTLPRCR